MTKQDGDTYVEVKLKTQWGRRKALKIYQRAVRKRNIMIEDLQVQVQRYRQFMTPEQLNAFDERYEDEDRTGKRNADRNVRREVALEVTPSEEEAVKLLVERMRHNQQKQNAKAKAQGNGHNPKVKIDPRAAGGRHSSSMKPKKKSSKTAKAAASLI